MHSFPYRFDNKIYRLYFPQIPVVKSSRFEEYGLGDYPSGTNAVVAVLSYTGYDMEDAMIVNKSSYERGFAHGCVYKTIKYDLNEGGRKNKLKMVHTVGKFQQECAKAKDLDSDGTPKIGTVVQKGTPQFAVFDQSSEQTKFFRNRDMELGRIDQIALVSGEESADDIKMLCKIRYPRNPVIGDKFSSRHGQKGILSILWPQVDMPFTESGITPDVIINPNAFPSRMTIGKASRFF